jgi:ABC-type antimicrobial peptide transport system permease subunit
MILFMIFKAILVGVIFGGLIFAFITARNNSSKLDSTQEQLNSQCKASEKKSTSMIITPAKIVIKFIVSCLIAIGILIVPFVILRIIL